MYVMKKLRITFVTLMMMASLFTFLYHDNAFGIPLDVIINEVDADQVSTDSAEFIELYDGGAGNTDLTGLALVLYNGLDDASYIAFDLDGLSTDANGYFVVCGNAANVANCDLDVSPDTNLIQNGADAVALIVGDAVDFPNDTPVTTTGLVDAIVYDTDDSDDAGLLVLLNAGQPQVNERDGGDGTGHSNQRCPNGSGGARNTDTYSQFAPTPGKENCPPLPDVTFNKVFSPDTIAYGGTSTLAFTINNTGSLVDATSLDFTDNLPAGVTVANPANASTTCTGGTLTAVAASSVISYTGGTVAGSSTCTVQADVTSSTSGTYVNTTGDLNSSLGNSGTASDSLYVATTLGTGNPSSYKVTVTKVELWSGTAWIEVFSGAAQLDVVAGGTFPGINNVDLPFGTYSKVKVTFNNSFPVTGMTNYGGKDYYTTATTFGGQTNLASTPTETAGSMAVFTFYNPDPTWGDSMRMWRKCLTLRQLTSVQPRTISQPCDLPSPAPLF